MPKKDLHPHFYSRAKFICTTCNNVMICGTTKGEEVRVDICSKCHPFYTGNQQFTTAAGRAEQFKSKFVKKEAIHEAVKKASLEQKTKNLAAKKATK